MYKPIIKNNNIYIQVIKKDSVYLFTDFYNEVLEMQSMSFAHWWINEKEIMEKA